MYRMHVFKVTANAHFTMLSPSPHPSQCMTTVYQINFFVNQVLLNCSILTSLLQSMLQLGKESSQSTRPCRNRTRDQDSGVLNQLLQPRLAIHYATPLSYAAPQFSQGIPDKSAAFGQWNVLQVLRDSSYNTPVNLPREKRGGKGADMFTLSSMIFFL